MHAPRRHVRAHAGRPDARLASGRFTRPGRRKKRARETHGAKRGGCWHDAAAMATPEDEQVLDELATLLATNGLGDFVFGPLLTPDPTFFPDAWRGDLASAEAMLRRLLAYARLGSLPFVLWRFDDPRWLEGEHERETTHHDAAAFFDGANEFGTYLFGVRADQWDDPMSLAGVLAHETAHAWRFRRDITSSHEATEERLTDLTSVFLGFGVLAAAVAYRHAPELQRRGYLPLHVVAFALGVQLVVRGDEAEWALIDDALGADARAIVRDVRRQWAPRRAELLSRLGLPAETTWKRPAPPTLPKPWSPRVASGRDVVFRVAEAPWWPVATVAAIVSGAVAMANQSWWPLLGLGLTPVAVLLRKDVCSGCRAPLASSASRCAGCGGEVKGRVRRRAEHTAAERAFLEAAEDTRAAEARDVVKDLLSRARDDDSK